MLSLSGDRIGLAVADAAHNMSNPAENTRNGDITELSLLKAHFFFITSNQLVRKLVAGDYGWAMVY